MKKSKFILLVHLLCLFFSSRLYAQNFFADSMRIHKQAYAMSKKDDTALLQLYVHLSNDYRRNNYDSALYYGWQGLKLAKRMNFKLGQTLALSNIEFGLRETGNLAEALTIQLQALDLARELKTKFLEGSELNSIGNTYLEMGDPKTGLYYYRSSLAIFREIKEPYWTRNERSNMGNAFEKMNMLDSALFYETAVYQDKLFPVDLLPELMGRLGNVYVKLGKYPEALAYYRKGLVYAVPVLTISDEAILYHQMAKVYNKINAPDSGIFYARKAFTTAQALSLRKIMLTSSELLADIYSRQANLDSAFHYQQVAMRYNDTLFGADKFSQIQHVLSNEQQRQQKIIKEKEQLKYRYELIGTVALLAFLLVIFLLTWRNNRVQKQKNGLLNTQKDQLTEQRDAMTLTLQNLHKTQAQLIQSEKMASLGELTAGIAHEIQNPLNFVNNFSEVNNEMIDELAEELRLGNINGALAIASEIKQNEEKINHHGKRADGIVKGMLQHSRTGTGEKQLTNINTLADEFFKLSYHGLRAKDKTFNAELVTHFDNTLPLVNISQQNIGRVLLNLFNNAFYAVNQKAKTAGPDYKPTVTVTTFAPPSGGWGVMVKDNGNGIPDAIKDKIMQPFFTTKPTGEGTGLGLSLSYDIVVKGHGGSIEINSQEDQGSEFIIRLPII